MEALFIPADTAQAVQYRYDQAGTTEALQEAVDGFFEFVRVGSHVTMIVNGDGEGDPNPRATGLMRLMFGTERTVDLVGDVLVVGAMTEEAFRNVPALVVARMLVLTTVIEGIERPHS
jgi:hypothetical protein